MMLGAAEATVLELGLNSTQGITLKGRVLRDMEAELTTFQLLKQPFPLVIECIDTARRETIGALIPELGPPPPVADTPDLVSAAATA